MLVTWPPHGQDGFLEKVTLKKFKFTIFFIKYIFSTFQVHSVPIKPVTFEITCQSCHLLSKMSIDLLRHYSCLLGKVKGKSFKCKLTEFVSWAFRYFGLQCKVNGKFGIQSPMSSYMCCKGTQNLIFGPNLSFHWNF